MLLNGWTLVTDTIQLRTFAIPTTTADRVRICLRACAQVNGCYVSARIHRFEHVSATPTNDDERFELIQQHGCCCYFALKTRDGTLWSAKRDGTIRADALTIGDAERFLLYTDRDAERVALKSWYGWLLALPNGTIETYIGNEFYESMIFTGWQHPSDSTH
jgi:hypothetical protein